MLALAMGLGGCTLPHDPTPVALSHSTEVVHARLRSAQPASTKARKTLTQAQKEELFRRFTEQRALRDAGLVYGQSGE